MDVEPGKKKWYIGVTGKRDKSYNPIAELFTSRFVPSRSLYPEYERVLGPFSSYKKLRDHLKLVSTKYKIIKNNPRIPKKVLAWRERQGKGSIMSPETFSRIEREAEAAGFDDPRAVAGAAYQRTLRAKYREAHNPEEEVFETVSGYDRTKHPEKKNYRYMTWQEAANLKSGDHSKVLDRHGRTRNVKVNGKPKTWKTRPGDVDVPWKYGMYEYGTARFRGGKSDGFLIVEVEEGNPPKIGSQEKILLSAFKAQNELLLRDIPGYFSDALTNLIDAGLIIFQDDIFMLTPKGRKFNPYQNNPPLPASSFLDIATARSIVREIVEDLDRGEAMNESRLKRLIRAVDMIKGGLDRLESSHRGHIDFSNPPPQKTEIYRDALEIRARKKDGRLYKHKFEKRGARIFGLNDGSIHIVSDQKLPLWKMFPDDKPKRRRRK